MFQGIYAPIPTPFVGETIDREALQHNLDRYSASRLAVW